MANQEQLNLLKQNVQAWNAWKEEHPNETVDLSYADLRRARLSKANLKGANLSHANLSDASLSDADLQDADLQNANLSGALMFSGVKLQRANLSRAKLNGVHLPVNNLSQASFFAADLRNTNLMGAFFLRDTDFREADFRGANLEDTDVEGADFRGANLSNINLGIMYPRGGDFRGANLSYARIMEYGDHISGFDLSNTNFEQANLSGADFHDTNLSGVSFRNAKLERINLSNANLQQADFRGADLSGANLSRTDLSNLNFQYANLSGANLQNTNLRGTNFHSADLSDTDLSSLDLRKADLQSANLRNANLHASQFLGTNLSEAVLTGACIADWQINSTTKLEGVKCDYIFRTYDPDNGEFTGRLPLAQDGAFAPDEFTQRFQIIADALETIDITFTKGIDWQAFFRSFQELRFNHPEANISVQGMERKGEAFVIRLELDEKAEKAPIETELKQLYAQQVLAIEAQYKEQLRLQGAHLEEAQRTIEAERQRNSEIIQVISTMAQTQGGQNFYGPVGNVANTNQGKMEAVLHNYAPEQRQNLAEAAAEIQALLSQLSETYSPVEVPGKAVEKIDQTPQLKDRVIGALKAGGKTALEELVEHPAVAIVLAAIEGAIEP